MEDPFKDSEKGLAYGAKASSEDDSQDINSAPDETEMVEGSLDETTTTVREGQYEHNSRPTPSPVCSSPSSFSGIFIFLCIISSILLASPRLAFQIEVEKNISLDLSFLDQILLH